VTRSIGELDLSTSHPEDHEELQPRLDEPLFLVHHHPGYLRVQADAFLATAENGKVANAAQAAAEAAPGFRSWALNPKTGSVVVEYDPDALEADELLKHIVRKAGFRCVENSTRLQKSRQELVSTFLNGVQDVNHVVGQMTGERADLRELVPAALAVTSVVSFIVNDDRGRLPHWSSALYRSYRVFMHWHRTEVRTRERDARQKEESGNAQ